tara:strand:+ start:2886 stop:2996 length:111 start_codon:yes stop_codon:yes gene_type:complete
MNKVAEILDFGGGKNVEIYEKNIVDVCKVTAIIFGV